MAGSSPAMTGWGTSRKSVRPPRTTANAPDRHARTRSGHPLAPPPLPAGRHARGGAAWMAGSPPDSIRGPAMTGWGTSRKSVRPPRTIANAPQSSCPDSIRASTGAAASPGRPPCARRGRMDGRIESGHDGVGDVEEERAAAANHRQRPQSSCPDSIRASTGAAASPGRPPCARRRRMDGRITPGLDPGASHDGVGDIEEERAAAANHRQRPRSSCPDSIRASTGAAASPGRPACVRRRRMDGRITPGLDPGPAMTGRVAAGKDRPAAIHATTPPLPAGAWCARGSAS